MRASAVWVSCRTTFCDVTAINPDLTPNAVERPVSPQIRGLDVVVGVCVKTLVRWWAEFVELMNKQENRIKPCSIIHKSVERGV